MIEREPQGWNPRLSDQSGLEWSGEVVTLRAGGRGGSPKDSYCTDGPGVEPCGPSPWKLLSYLDCTG